VVVAVTVAGAIAVAVVVDNPIQASGGSHESATLGVSALAPVLTPIPANSPGKARMISHPQGARSGVWLAVELQHLRLGFQGLSS